MHEVRPSTLREYQGDGRTYMAHLGATIPVNLITLEMIEEMFKALAGRKGRTKLKHVAMVRRFFNYCVTHRHCRENVARLMTIPRKWRRQARESATDMGQALSPDEARALLRASWPASRNAEYSAESFRGFS